MTGRYVTLEPLQVAHAASLWPLQEDHLWDYMFDGPFSNEQEFTESIARKSESHDPQAPRFLAVLVNHQAVGIASFMRDDPKHRVIEVGSIVFTRALQRTTAATEAMFLMAKYAFEEMQYRRYEWKCNALNLLSRRAAERLGFTLEGIFRQHMIVKGQNRDTAWFSMLDSEWPARKIEFERWLHPSNFTEDGTQLTHLSH